MMMGKKKEVWEEKKEVGQDEKVKKIVEVRGMFMPPVTKHRTGCILPVNFLSNKKKQLCKMSTCQLDTHIHIFYLNLFKSVKQVCVCMSVCLVRFSSDIILLLEMPLALHTLSNIFIST